MFPSRHLLYWIRAVAAFIVIWCIITVILRFAYCVPIEAAWDPTVAGHCISTDIIEAAGIIGTTTTAIHILTDFIILIMPIPPVLKLQVSSQKKRLILMTFAIGSR